MPLFAAGDTAPVDPSRSWRLALRFALWWHPCLAMWSLANYLDSVKEERLTHYFRQTHMGFLIAMFVSLVGGAGFALIGSGLSARAKRSALNMAAACVFVAGDTPLFFLNLYIVHQIGVTTPWVGIDATLRTVSWIASFLYLWVVYLDMFSAQYFKAGGTRPKPQPLLDIDTVRLVAHERSGYTRRPLPDAAGLGGYDPL